MTSSENENPYQSPDAEESLTSAASPSTTSERVLLIVVAILVAIPTFFTTCIGGGVTLIQVFGLHYQFPEETLIVLSFACFLLASWAGFAVARWLYRRKRRRASLGDDQ